MDYFKEYDWNQFMKTMRFTKPTPSYIAICTDTENNGFGIFEADVTAK